MTAAPQGDFIGVDEYLEGELGSGIRHEYIGGRVYAMGGASRAHGSVVTALTLGLGPSARETRCQLFVADMKVRLRIQGQDVFYYPDLVLTCDPDDRETYWCTRPCLIVEVLSPATERIDRGEKRLAYQTLDSLREYLLVAQDRPRVEVYRRARDWRREIHGEGSVHLDCLDLDLPLAEIYAGVV